MEDGLFQRVAGKTAVAGGAAVQRLTALVVAQKREGTALGKAVALALCQHVGDVQQLVCRVVRELDLVGEAAGKTAVGGKEHLHLPGVARQNDHQLVPVILHALHKGVDGFEAKAVLLAAVEAVGFIDKQHTAEGTLDDAVCQRGGVAGVAAHKVGTGHFHQLATLQRADGLEVLCHQPGNGGLAGARVAGEDHVHGKAGGLEACRRAALLHLQVIRQTEHILLDRPKAHKAVEFGADFIYSARVLGRQQGRQLLLGLVVQAEPYALRLCGQGDGAGKLCIGLQAVFTQGAEDLITGFRKARCALFFGAPGCNIVPHIGPCTEGQAKADAHLLGQRIQLLRRQRCKVLGGKGAGGAHIAHRCHKGRTELIRQRVPALAGKEDEVLAAGGDAAHRARSQRRARIHKDALLVHQIPAGKRRTALDGQIGQRFQEAGVAALVMLKDHDLPGGVQGRIQILQKQLFRTGIGVEGKVHHRGFVALQKAPRRHDAGGLCQRKVPPRTGTSAQQDHIACCRALGAQHKGPAHGAHHAVHKGILPENGLFHLGGKALKAAKVLCGHIGSALGKQAVRFHIPQHLAAVLQSRLHRSVLRFQLGVLFFEQGIQLLLVFQQGSVQVRHCGRFGLWRFAFRLGGAAKARLSPCAEHTVHKVFPIVGICHGLPSVFVVFFQYSVPGQLLQFPLEKSTPVVYTYCMENKKKE